MLEYDNFDPEIFYSLMKSLKDLCNPLFMLLDFEYHNEKLLKKLKKEKIRLIKIQDFEAAVRLREKEEECMNYISIRTEYRIEKSAFYYDQNNLFYFYLGTAKFDKKSKEYFIR